jgi:hypothetical protein
MADFEAKLSVMVSKELCGDAETVSALIERLTDALGLAVAVSCGGDVSKADTMLTGVEGYLAEAIAHHSKLAAFISEIRRFKRDTPA